MFLVTKRANQNLNLILKQVDLVKSKLFSSASQPFFWRPKSWPKIEKKILVTQFFFADFNISIKISIFVPKFQCSLKKAFTLNLSRIS